MIKLKLGQTAVKLIVLYNANFCKNSFMAPDITLKLCRRKPRKSQTPWDQIIVMKHTGV